MRLRDALPEFVGPTLTVRSARAFPKKRRSPSATESFLAVQAEETFLGVPEAPRASLAPPSARARPAPAAGATAFETTAMPCIADVPPTMPTR